MIQSQVMRSLPEKHQTLLFSATMPVEIEALAQVRTCALAFLIQLSGSTRFFILFYLKHVLKPLKFLSC